MFFYKLVAAFSFVLSATAAAVPRAQTYTGEATWYKPAEVGAGNSVGACGTRIVDSDPAVALSYKVFDTYPGGNANDPNNNPICGKKLRASYNGNSVTLKVVDRCHDCEGMYNLDMTPSNFRKLASLDEGRIKGVEWQWVDE